MTLSRRRITYQTPVVYFTDSSLLAEVSYVLCLDALGNGEELHVSPASPNPHLPPAILRDIRLNLHLMCVYR